MQPSTTNTEERACTSRKGWAKNQPAAFGIPDRFPAVGARIGFDIDWHIERFIMGWSFRCEALKQIVSTVGPGIAQVLR